MYSFVILLIHVTTGIGRQIALLLAKEGATVVCGDIASNARDDSDAPTHDEIMKNGGKAVFQKTDVTQEADMAALVDAAFMQFGRLDIMVNNAGIAVREQDNRLMGMPTESISLKTKPRHSLYGTTTRRHST